VDTYCRSPQEIADDALLTALTMCDDALNEFIPNMGYLFRGQQRDRIKQLKARFEDLILNGQPWDRSVPVTWYAHHTIYG
jgi:hypothetical protein